MRHDPWDHLPICKCQINRQCMIIRYLSKKKPKKRENTQSENKFCIDKMKKTITSKEYNETCIVSEYN
jgi:hypothetical protein